jgi:hypothetical protein
VSTKCSINYVEGAYHLYYELFDDRIYLQLEGDQLEFEVTQRSITVALPENVLRVIQALDVDALKKNMAWKEELPDGDTDPE